MLYLLLPLAMALGAIVGWNVRGLIDAFKNEKAARKALDDWRRERFLQGRAYMVLRAQEGKPDEGHLH